MLRCYSDARLLLLAVTFLVIRTHSAESAYRATSLLFLMDKGEVKLTSLVRCLVKIKYVY